MITATLDPDAIAAAAEEFVASLPWTPPRQPLEQMCLDPLPAWDHDNGYDPNTRPTWRERLAQFRRRGK